MANYADYIQFPDTVINGNYVERYAFPDSTGVYTDSVAWYRTPEGYKVVDRADAKLYKQDHPEGKPYVTKTYSENERQKLFNDAFGKSKLEDVEQKSDGGILSQAPKELVELVQAAMSDEGAAQKLSQLMSQRPDLTDMVEQIAAELQGAQAMKCGGRVKKKALGSKLVKTQKAKCGCELKKVGGRLVEVDSCTGLPIHRNGGNVAKFQSPWATLSYFSNAANLTYPQPTAQAQPDTTSSQVNPEAKKSFDAGKLYVPGQKQPGKSENKVVATPLFTDPNLRSLAQRQQWVMDNKDYLMANGWSQDDVDNYKGQTAAINYKLRDAINAKAAWDAEQAKVPTTRTYSNSQLLGMTNNAVNAAELTEEDKARRDKLMEYQNARNQALTFKGNRYDNEQQYNAAVDKYNLAQAGQAAATRQSNMQQSAGDNPRRQAAFDLMGKVMSGSQNFFDLSNREQRQLRRMRNRDMRNGLYTDEKSAKAFYTPRPDVAGYFKGNAALTEQQLNANKFNSGGQFNYDNYLN